MNKVVYKLVAAGLALAVAVTLVLMTTYAWFTLSASPEVGGIQVTIGDNTILIAPDMAETVEGVTYHYPGKFDDTLNFGAHDSYDYLDALMGLMPVSTADGLHWFLPVGDDTNARNRYTLTGQSGETNEVFMDDVLDYGNIAADGERKPEGSYIYADFWIVAPDSDYTLRVSTGKDDGGSYLIELPQAARSVSGEYSLEDSTGVAAAVARIGFLSNDAMVKNDAMLYYQRSAHFNSSYSELRGNYQERGEAIDAEQDYSFCIYEPNGDYHPTDLAVSGSYIPTCPVGLLDGIVSEISTQQITAVQKHTRWIANENGRFIDQMFQTYLVGKDLSGMEPEEVTREFYRSFQGNLSTYLSKGEFVKHSTQLTNLTGEEMDQLDTEGFTGAADDVYIIELERNVPQRIRMFIWLEGQDADCRENPAASDFSVNIELAGSNQK